MTEDLLTKLLDVEHSRAQTDKICSLIRENQVSLDQLFKVITGAHKKRSQRAGWVLSVLAEEIPTLFENKIGELFDFLQLPLHDSVHRGASKLLSRLELPEKHLSQAFDIALAYCYKKSSGVACKIWMMDTLDRICLKYPDFQGEVLNCYNTILPTSSPGLGNKLRKSIQKINGNFERQ